MTPRTRTAALILCGLLISLPSIAQTGGAVPDFVRDLNQDGTIDFKDLLILIESWGLEGIVTPTPTSTSIAVQTETPTETPVDQNTFTVEIPFDAPYPMKMVRIPAGSFMMGSPDTERGRDEDEGPVHQVTITDDFYMSETEVTQAQWEAVMGSLPDCSPQSDVGTGDNLPVYCVSPLDCQDFLAALNALSQSGAFRLPSEAEWEYACRAGTTTRFYFGNSLGCSDGCVDCEVTSLELSKQTSWPSAGGTLGSQPKLPLPMFPFRSEYMLFCPNSNGMVHEVRSLRPNAFGLFDMSGNVSEWVQDLYHPDYTGAPTDGSAWLTPFDITRVSRGGSFSISAGFCRSAGRGRHEAERHSTVGFRIVWTP